MNFWKFIKNLATETEPERVELKIEGEIVDDNDLWLYEWLGYTAVSDNSFKAALLEHRGKEIKLVVDSPGGNLFAGIGMYNALKEHVRLGGKLTSETNKWVASSATLPYLAADTRIIGPGDSLMIHRPMTGGEGYSDDFRKIADDLDEISEGIINIYQRATNLSRNKIAEMMKAETIMTARTAVREGFSTEIREDSSEERLISMADHRESIFNSNMKSLKKLVALKHPDDLATEAKSNEEVEIAIAKLALQLSL